MDWIGLAAIITALTGTLVAFGGGIRWMLSRVDKLNTEERERQDEERKKLELAFEARIAALEERIRIQDTEIESTRSELRAYVRHVGILEGLLKANGVDVPPLEISKNG